MSQVPPVAAAVAVSVSPVVENLYILVYVSNTVVDDLDEEDPLWYILYWTVFKIEAQLVLLAEYGLALFLDARMLTEKEVSTMASGFATRTQGNVRFHFFTRRSKYLK